MRYSFPLSLACTLICCGYSKDIDVKGNGESAQLWFSDRGVELIESAYTGRVAVGAPYTLYVARYNAATVNCRTEIRSGTVQLQGIKGPQETCEDRGDTKITLVDARCDDDGCTTTSREENNGLAVTVTPTKPGARQLQLSVRDAARGDVYSDTLRFDAVSVNEVRLLGLSGWAPLVGPMVVGYRWRLPEAHAADAQGVLLKHDFDAIKPTLTGSAASIVGRDLQATAEGKVTLGWALGSLSRSFALESVSPSKIKALRIYRRHAGSQDSELQTFEGKNLSGLTLVPDAISFAAGEWANLTVRALLDNDAEAVVSLTEVVAKGPSGFVATVDEQHDKALFHLRVDPEQTSPFQGSCQVKAAGVSAEFPVQFLGE